MSKRLDQEREAILQPQRIDYAVKALADIGIESRKVDNTELEFTLPNGVKGKLFAYSGWWSAKGIGDGRGIYNLIQQLKRLTEATQ